MADRIHYGGEWKWAKKVTDLLNEGGGGNVDDVMVDGVSVVDANKVAQIDLTPYAKTADLATVATSGSYTDLSNKPTIPTKTSDLTNDSDFVSDASYVHTDNNFTSTEKNKLSGIASGAEVNVQSDWSQSDSTADDYIKNKPTIPTVNDGTLTVKNGDQTKGTFTANQSSASNIVVLPFDIVGDLTTGFTPIYPS